MITSTMQNERLKDEFEASKIYCKFCEALINPKRKTVKMLILSYDRFICPKCKQSLNPKDYLLDKVYCKKCKERMINLFHPKQKMYIFYCVKCGKWEK